MVYRDSTDDGFDADIIDEFTDGTEFELEEEAQRLGQRLEFLSTVARLWRQVAIAWKMDAPRRRSPRAARKLVPTGDVATRQAPRTGRCRSPLSDPRSREARTNRWSNSTGSE